MFGVSGIPGVCGGRESDGGGGSGVGDVGGEVGGEVGGTDGLVGGKEGLVGSGGEVGGRGTGDWVGDFGKSNSCHVPGIKAMGSNQVAVNVTP